MRGFKGDLLNLCFVGCASCTHTRIYALWAVSMRGFVLCGLCWLHPERIYCALWVVPMRGFIMLCGLCPWEDLLCFVGCAHGRIHALWVVPMRGFTMLCGLCPWWYIILCGLRFSEAMVSWTLSGHKRQVSWHNNTTKWTSTQKSLKTLPPKMNALSWPGNFSFLRKELTNLITSNNLGLHCWLIQRLDYNTRSKNKEFCFLPEIYLGSMKFTRDVQGTIGTMNLWKAMKKLVHYLRNVENPSKLSTFICIGELPQELSL